MKLEFTLKELQIIDQAIQQIPYYIAAPLIANINKQISEQQAEMDEPVEIEKVCQKTHQQNGE